ncbi:nitroreductase family protein [Pseudomonas cichorii]|uniref:Putative NAD(P)H nitroreductase n=2 Tax=Pseudomonas syringae group TaxID=136849 RepID=A0A3M4WFE7_PSECI|nr:MULTISPECIES: nitroreductase family protein [Pseudomonas syringae group]AHF68834.1 nitroreductase family protein [Pseudomonas cichorii JBC1]MBI6852378.1 nitroreductase family protein [Pseudomonas cichorii]MBX8489999.1 nitroreductase family protein [Pseudomonas cichorii]MBX8497701.1 nitroreductase family protein [Pseudomonas cichorii]MBX8500036.1 nitroreductase family protein [Pseudomonas lijiangensis]
MEALDVLLNRVSVPRLVDPAPDAAQREILFGAALRSPDHGQLRPYRFITVEGPARERMGELLVEALQQGGGEITPQALDKARLGPLRAPLVVVVVARLQDHFKVPRKEQLITAGCAAHAVLLAAYAQGVGAVWRTGDLSYSPHVAKGFGLADDEEVIAFLYLGTPQNPPREAPKVDVGGFVSEWQG